MWREKLRKETANLSGRVAETRKFFNKHGSLVNKYKGGMPAGFMAAIAQWESGGKMNSVGDAQLGEVGFFQVAKTTPSKFGLRPEIRRIPEGNTFVAGLEYNTEAKRLALRYPSYVKDGTKDQWMLARLVFAIGRAGTYKLIDAALNKNLIQPGAVYNGVQALVETNSMPLGTQSAEKVWYRVNAVPLQWAVGNTISTAWSGFPSRVPAFVQYSLPQDVRDHLKSGGGFGLAALTLLLLFV